MEITTNKQQFVLLGHCPDKPGLVAAIAQHILSLSGNIVSLHEYVDAASGRFYVRVCWQMPQGDYDSKQLEQEFGTDLLNDCGMAFNIHESAKRVNVALFVSRHGHCLYEILTRHHAGEWNIEIPLIISNHNDMADVAARFEIPYFVLPITADNKKDQEMTQMRLLKEYKVDLLVLARYMQILSSEFVANSPFDIINIHHSSLPAFAGAKPYHAARERGVKLIGATSHYVTADLDAGPIIEQDVVRVSHRDAVEDLIRKGRDVEKLVLAKAMRAHLLHAVIVCDNRTVVFDH